MKPKSTYQYIQICVYTQCIADKKTTSISRIAINILRTPEYIYVVFDMF